jgi:hypothetical protein
MGLAIFGLPREWFLFICACVSIICCTHKAHEDSLCQVVDIHAEVWNKLCMASRDRDAEILIQCQHELRIESVWIYFIVLIAHSEYVMLF